MNNYNPIEKELNEIRVLLYEETKNMSPSELTEYIKAQTEPMLKKYGITPLRGYANRVVENKRVVV